MCVRNENGKIEMVETAVRAEKKMEDLGHVHVEDKRGDGNIRIVQLTDLHQWPAGVNTFEARGRVIDFDKEGYDTSKNVKLVEHVLDRMKPDLVVLTGDILDGRPCKDMSREKFKEVMMDVLQPIVERDILWTFCPGNHDDDHSPWSREDLLEIFKLHGCASAKASSFDHTFSIGHTENPSKESSVRIWLFDSGANSPDEKIRYTTFSPESVKGYKDLSQSDSLGATAVGLAFFHIPLPEYEGLVPLAGKNGLFAAALKAGKVPFPFNHQPFTSLVRLLNKHWIAGCSRLNSGIFEAFVSQGNVLATFVGHDHHCDWIAKRESVYLCYGRCGGFTPPHHWEGAATDLPFDHGARVIEVDGRGKATTWATTFTKDQEDIFELAQ